MENELIKYNFYHWGPLLYKSNVTLERRNKILSICDKATESKAPELAGHLKKELVLPEVKIFSILNPYFTSYLRVNKEQYNAGYIPRLTMESSWVNYMTDGEFNPPHNHGGILSFVLYLKVPDELKKENKEYIGRSIGPGGIDFRIDTLRQEADNYRSNHFHFPEEGDIFIFPASLEHWAFPFKSKVTRISVSGNLHEAEKERINGDKI